MFLDAYVTATAWWKPNTDTVYRLDANATVFRRSQTGDHGLGICSQNETCGTGNGKGDWNEISNNINDEYIRLALAGAPHATEWTALWVSSLDAGGSHNNESGLLRWSNNAELPLSGGITFSYNSLKNFYSTPAQTVEFDLLPYVLATYGGADTDITTAQYLFFTNDSSNGTNNDYLLWKVATDYPPPVSTPEPSTWLMLATGLVALLGLSQYKRLKAWLGR